LGSFQWQKGAASELGELQIARAAALVMTAWVERGWATDIGEDGEILRPLSEKARRANSARRSGLRMTRLNADHSLGLTLRL